MHTVMPPRTLDIPSVVPEDALAEANHRIANNLTMIAGLVLMHARAISATPETMSNGKVRVLLEEIGGRIDSIAHLHALLARNEHGEPIELAGYLREISTMVVNSLTFMGKSELTHACSQECRLAPERALPLGLIVGELVTNAVKYAHPAGVVGMITVGCLRSNGSIVVEVGDDGVGLPDGFDVKENQGLGMRLMHSLAEQLKGELVFYSTGIGLLVQLRLPAIAAG